MSRRILPVKDGFQERAKDHWLFKMPFRVAFIGRSQAAGKTTLLANLLLRKEFYPPGTWQGIDVWIISGTQNSDPKVRLIQRGLRIPDDNVTDQYTEAKLAEIYETIKARSKANPKKHFLLILDDIAFNLNASQNNGVLSELAMSSRHYGLSMALLSQKNSQIPTTLRENLSGVIAWGCSRKQEKSLCDDHDRIGAKAFCEMHRACTKDSSHDFMVIRPNRPVKEMYLDSNFKNILVDDDDDGDD